MYKLMYLIAAAGPVIEKIEIEIQVGDKAAEKIIKVINLSEEEEIIENRNVLQKLKNILVPSLKNSTVVSSSSSSSRSLSSRSSSSRSSISSSSSSSSSSHRIRSSSQSSSHSASSSSSRSSALSKVRCSFTTDM